MLHKSLATAEKMGLTKIRTLMDEADYHKVQSRVFMLDEKKGSKQWHSYKENYEYWFAQHRIYSDLLNQIMEPYWKDKS